MLSDLLHHYQVDLRGLFRDEDPLSPRYVLALVLDLPKDGAFYASRRGGREYRGWDETRYALAELVDAMSGSNYMFQMANRDPAKPKPKLPSPFPRPDNSEPKKAAPAPNSFAGIVASMMAEQRRRRDEQANGN